MAKYSLGIDCGSTPVKGVLFDGEKVVDSRLVATSARPALRMHEVYEKLWNEDVGYVVTTGYGRELLPEANKKVTEITCHAKGAHFLGGSVGGVIDIGGQDSKAILLDKDGNVADFLMNDKCAAGTGRFLDVMARVLEVKVSEMEELGMQSTKEAEISPTCTVFAESAVISALAQGTDKRDIINGIHKSIASRVSGLARRIGVRDDVVMTGGVAQNGAIVAALEEQLGHPILTSPLTQYNGALGAALYAYEKALRNAKTAK